MPLPPHHTYYQHNTLFFSHFILSHIFFTFRLLYFSLISIFLHTHFFTFCLLSSFNTSLSLSLTLCFTYCMLNPVPTLQPSDFCESQFPSCSEALPHGSSRIKTHFGTTIWGSFLIVVLINNSTILIKNQDPIPFGSIHCNR